ncbi:glycosyl transferase, group 1 [Micrococcus lylae]|uniref:Glycosyl transferase, group 1 n=1 Tax=Micrococcus lylae TaxID=1273 RepID=A0A1R4INJ4_9MICC|nr:glycosyl transferase, group 1 [Micrococcus lylae]
MGTVTDRPLRLLMDARYTRTDFHDGISRYGASLIAAVHRLTTAGEWAGRVQMHMLVSDEAQLRLLPAGVPWHRATGPTSPLEPTLPVQVNRLRPDVVFSPMQTMGSAGRRYGLILTLHDLIYYEHRTPPRNLPEPVRWLWRLYHLGYGPQRLLLNRADRVATVSQTTAGLIAEHALTRRPVDVVPNAPQPVAEPRNPDAAPARSLVYMGSFMDYKDVDSLVAAMPLLPGYTLHLLSTVPAERRAELEALLARRRAETGAGTATGAHGAGAGTSGEVVFHNGVTDEEYIALLREATALVTLSRAEGYGLPVAEAMSHGTPVIGSDMPIFREVAGGAEPAFLPVPLDGDRPAAFAAQVRTLTAPGAWAAASRAAVGRAARYRWEDSAARLLAAVESVADERAQSRSRRG